MITTRSAILAVAALLAAISPAPALAKKRVPSTAFYSVSFRAEMKDQWQAREISSSDCELTGVMCVRDQEGKGDATLSVRTRHPFRMMVMKGANGRPPQINVGTGEGAPVTGPYTRNGSVTTTYSGPWKAGNPDTAIPDQGCGRKSLDGDVNFTWEGRNQLRLTPMLDVFREDCPVGLPTGWRWDGSGDEPELSAVIAQTAQSKFLRARQFTVHGTKRWVGSVDPTHTDSYTKDGTRTVSWQWEATFRMEGRKKRR